MDRPGPFAGRRTRVLSMDDVRRLLDPREALEVQRHAFLAHASGITTVAPNAWLRLPEPRRAWLKLLAGHDPSASALGVKILARFPENPPGANLGSLVLLFDEDDGFPLAILEGAYITAVRTGAGAGLATEVLARSDARSIGLVGTGVVAWYSLMSVVLARPGLRRVTVYSRSQERREAFAARARDELGVEAVTAGSVADAVAGTDVVITASNSAAPVLMAENVEPGQLVNAMGIRFEVDPVALARCVLVVDGRQESANEGKVSVGIAAGTVTADDVRAELGEVLAGTAAVTPSNDETILFDSSGVAIQDVDAAHLVWERAEREGIGTLVDLGLASSP